MKPSKFFTTQEFEQIQNTVQETEKKISGEIVPVFLQQSDSYRETYWKSICIFTSIAMMAIVAREFFWKQIIFYTPLDIVLILGISIIVGFLTTYIPSYKRLLIGKSTMQERVTQAAESLFLQENVMETKHRTGILILLSLFERTVFIKADKGIAEKVSQEEWDDIIAQITATIKQGKQAKAITNAIEYCGILIEKHGFVIASDDTNELPNTLRVRKRVKK